MTMFFNPKIASVIDQEEADDAGIWQTKAVGSSIHPRLQILTPVPELNEGKKINMPAE
ncbi:MAG TPA: hypothetical protein VHS31_17285 [Tepidisphaeraceae bacterium]|jgi:hypothetical protein|nr:hypothetical protein [Tepidisphaeraceae bacterium]